MRKPIQQFQINQQRLVDGTHKTQVYSAFVSRMRRVQYDMFARWLLYDKRAPSTMNRAATTRSQRGRTHTYTHTHAAATDLTHGRITYSILDKVRTRICYLSWLARLCLFIYFFRKRAAFVYAIYKHQVCLMCANWNTHRRNFAQIFARFW